MDFKVEDCGVHHAQFFTGRGTSFTQFDAVYMGAGLEPKWAFSDAVENMAQVESLEKEDLDKLKTEEAELLQGVDLDWSICQRCEYHHPEKKEPCTAYDTCEVHYYVALFVKH